MYRKIRPGRRRLEQQVDQPQEQVVRQREEPAHPDPHAHLRNAQIARSLLDSAELLDGALQQLGVELGHGLQAILRPRPGG
jgi:hypothetical protein